MLVFEKAEVRADGKKLADLPPLPAVVTRIMQTVNNPDTSAEDLNKLISMDQGLASKVLRIVNSGLRRQNGRLSSWGLDQGAGRHLRRWLTLQRWFRSSMRCLGLTRM